MNKKQFYHREIANLAWVIGSSSLMSSSTQHPNILNSAWFREQYDLHSSWLMDLDNNGVPESLKFENLREPLGKIFERYVGFWLRESPHFTVHAQNLQVNTSQTVGEFDFIFSDQSRHYHLEVACKFYLARTNSSAWNNWIGPNGTDSLAEKMIALHRQTKLSEHPAGKAVLKQIGIPSVEPIAMIKGYFFHHYTNILHAKSPLGSSSDYNSGWWVYADELALFISETASYIILPKAEWLAQWHQPDHESILHGNHCIEVCRQEIKRTNAAVALVQLIDSDGFWIEMSRGFVVSRLPFQRSSQSLNS